MLRRRLLKRNNYTTRCPRPLYIPGLLPMVGFKLPNNNGSFLMGIHKNEPKANSVRKAMARENHKMTWYLAICRQLGYSLFFPSFRAQLYKIYVYEAGGAPCTTFP